MKILWHSNAPWVGTGYGSQTAIFAPRLKAIGHDVAISAFYGLHGTGLDYEGLKIYPSDDEWGNRWTSIMATEHSGTQDPRDVLIITLMDVWVMLPGKLWSQLKMASWVPVDHVPVPIRVFDFFQKQGSIPIAMSRFGEQQLQLAGLDPLYVPHGVVTSKMVPRGQAEARAVCSQGPHKIPDDAFVVGMVAANMSNNPSRKGFPQAFQAFAEIRRRHPEALLYLHTELQAGRFGLDLRELALATGVPIDSIRYTPPWQLFKGVDYPLMSWFYSAFDVLLCPSYGEGFGVPIVEAQACGTPVVVNDFSSMPELCGAGWAVDGDPWYDATQGAWFQSANVASIVEALEAAYQAKGTAEADTRSQEAVAFAQTYDADLIVETYWKPVLEQIQIRLAERDLPPVVGFKSRPTPKGRRARGESR